MVLDNNDGELEGDCGKTFDDTDVFVSIVNDNCLDNILFSPGFDRLYNTCMLTGCDPHWFSDDFRGK